MAGWGGRDAAVLGVVGAALIAASVAAAPVTGSAMGAGLMGAAALAAATSMAGLGAARGLASGAAWLAASALLRVEAVSEGVLLSPLGRGPAPPAPLAAALAASALVLAGVLGLAPREPGWAWLLSAAAAFLALASLASPMLLPLAGLAAGARAALGMHYWARSVEPR